MAATRTCPTHEIALESKSRTVAMRDSRTDKEIEGTITFEMYWVCPNGGCSYEED